MSKESTQLRLQIEPVIKRADGLVETVARDLPTHKGLKRAVLGVANASRNAERAAGRLRRVFGLHRMPALFLLVSLGALGFWIYLHFFYNSTLTLALSSRDAVQLRDDAGHRVKIVSIETAGSRESIALLEENKADLAFVQGGIDLPENLISTELESTEMVLFFTRQGVSEFGEITTVLTSSQGQGSHTLAQTFAQVWRIDGQVDYVFDWRQMTDDPSYEIAPKIDAIFVVKDPMNDKVTATMARIHEAGFRLASPDIGASRMRMPYLSEFEIRPGFLDPVAHIPEQSVATYSVATYLVARPDLTPRQRAAAKQLHATGVEPMSESAFEPSFDQASEVAQGIEAMVGILIYVALAFIALLGLDIITYRRYFNELNTLVSLISMHQSSKDAMTSEDAVRKHNIEYLSICSDLLGLISVITGYYTQENPSLLYHRLPEIIHDRCDALKINIQLKILHGLTTHEDEGVPGESQAALGDGIDT